MDEIRSQYVRRLAVSGFLAMVLSPGLMLLPGDPRSQAVALAVFVFIGGLNALVAYALWRQSKVLLRGLFWLGLPLGAGAVLTVAWIYRAWQPPWFDTLIVLAVAGQWFNLRHKVARFGK